MLLWLQQSDDSEETQSEEYDFEDTVVDFGKLLFLALVSSRVSSPDVLYSLGLADEDIEIAINDFDVTVTVGDAVAGMLSQEHAGKDLVVIITVEEVVASMPSQRHVISSTIHDIHHSKEPLGMMIMSHLY